jgi:hypothetical protein
MVDSGGLFSSLRGGLNNAGVLVASKLRASKVLA